MADDRSIDDLIQRSRAARIAAEEVRSRYEATVAELTATRERLRRLRETMWQADGCAPPSTDPADPKRPSGPACPY